MAQRVQPRLVGAGGAGSTVHRDPPAARCSAHRARHPSPPETSRQRQRPAAAEIWPGRPGERPAPSRPASHGNVRGEPGCYYPMKFKCNFKRRRSISDLVQVFGTSVRRLTVRYVPRTLAALSLRWTTDWIPYGSRSGTDEKPRGTPRWPAGRPLCSITSRLCLNAEPAAATAAARDRRDRALPVTPLLRRHFTARPAACNSAPPPLLHRPAG